MSNNVRDVVFDLYKKGGEQEIRKQLLTHPEYLSDLVSMGFAYMQLQAQLTGGLPIQQQRQLRRPETEYVAATKRIASNAGQLTGRYVEHCPKCGKSGYMRIYTIAGERKPLIYHTQDDFHHVQREIEQQTGYKWEDILEGKVKMIEKPAQTGSAIAVIEEDEKDDPALISVSSLLSGGIREPQERVEDHYKPDHPEEVQKIATQQTPAPVAAKSAINTYPTGDT